MTEIATLPSLAPLAAELLLAVGAMAHRLCHRHRIVF